ncbi:MAG: hypothetical protein ABI723_11020 [Bacteroidia bacterium]
MTIALKKVITRINRLDEKEQDAIAEMLSKELDWDKSYKESQPQLANLAEEALAEYKAGKTQPLRLK